MADVNIEKVCIQFDAMKQFILSDIFSNCCQLYHCSFINIDDPSSSLEKSDEDKIRETRLKVRLAFEFERMNPDFQKALREAGIPLSLLGTLRDSFTDTELDSLLDVLQFDDIADKLRDWISSINSTVHFIDAYADLIDFGIVTALQIHRGFIEDSDSDSAWSEFDSLCENLVDLLKMETLLSAIFGYGGALYPIIRYVASQFELSIPLDPQNPFYHIAQKIGELYDAMPSKIRSKKNS